MTTSGFTLFELNRDQLINTAYRKLGQAKGQIADTEDLANGAIALNMALSKLQTIGMPLWARMEYTFSPVANTPTYLIGVGKTLNTPFPLKVQQALLVDINSGSNLEMDIKTIYDYNTIQANGSTGQPIQFMYQPLVNYGKIVLWPTPDPFSVLNKQIKIVYQRPFEDFVSGTDTPDFPQEWTTAVVYELACLLAPEWGLPLVDRQSLRGEADRYAAEALSFGNDEASMYLSPMERPFNG